MFKKKFPSLSSLGSDGNTSFLRAARAGHLDKVLEQLKNNVDINTSNANGLNALHLASKDGHIHVVTELLKRGANVDSATKKGNTALHIASLAGQEEVVKLLVEHSASVNVQSQNGFTPLYMAAQENHDNVVRFLLSNGANQSLATEDGFTPLAVAMQQGHDKVVAVLLENDTRGKVRLPALHIAAKKDDCKAAALLLQNEHNPDVTSKSGFTPLHIASHYGNQDIANLLLNKGADVNYSAKHNITPLHVAAKWGKSNMVGLLLEKGANIESKTRDGLTPLHCAARSGHEQVVDMLLERGAPISSKTKNGLAPLHMSSQGDHVDAARILLYHRAPVDEVTVDYLTALHVAAHCGHARVAKLLLDRKADPNARALNGFTPLHIACKKNRIKVVELLLKHGASIEATTESGLTPLHVASFMGCMNIVIYLLQNEANPDVPTVRGETPLHLAARANQTDIIRILLRNGAQVDARAREQQTPLHIAARLGNVDIVMLLLQHGAAVDSTTKDLYTALHIAAKEGQDEVAQVLLENGASPTATTKKGFTPLHLASKYGNMKVASLLLQRDAPVDAQGKNGVTPLHVASHYDHQNVALLLLDKGASPHATAKNGHTPLHIAAKKNQMDIATTLLEYGAKADIESKAGFTPLHLSAQEGHIDMTSLLIDHQADTNHKAKNGLTPLHLCAQEDRVNVATVLVKNGAEVDATTKAGYTPLHVASHFGQLNMVRFLVDEGAKVGATTSVGYTPLHQAAQQGHSTIVNTLLESGAPPNATTNQGQTALSIAQKLGYISVVESLKGVTEPTTIITANTDEKYKVVSPETMQETFMSDSEDEGGEDTLLSEQPYRYLTVDEMKSLGDDSLPIDVTRDERADSNRECMTAPPTAVDDTISPQHLKETYSEFATPDNIDIGRHPLHVGFLVSFLVDARGGAMRGCRHSGVRVIVPPRRASQPMRVTCRYLKRDKLSHPPPLMEGEALASRILELGPVGAKFLGPVMIEVPHFGSLRGKEREIVILRSDNGETWREHTVDASEDAVQDILSHSFDKEEISQLEDAGRTTRILTTDFPHYFAVVTRVRQEVHAIGPEGGMVSSSVVPQVQAVFPQGALTKKIKVGLQAQPIPAELAAKLLGNRVAVSPIVTVEPRRRKFHKPITLTIPKPQAANKGMINQYSGDAPTLRLLCSITGGTTRAQWEDVTGSTPFTFVNDCVSFTTTVSARFWLMDCRNVVDATKMATELYREAIHVPFMAKFVVFAKRVGELEARLRVFCMTDDKEDKTLEHQEHFTEVAKSRDVEVLEGKSQYVEFAGNLIPVTKSGEQLQLGFRAFRENRLPFTVRVKDPHADTIGRTLFMREPKVPKGEPPQQPICILNIVLPEEIIPETGVIDHELHKYNYIKDSSGFESYQRADLRLSDISNLLGEDWVRLAGELNISTSDINRLKTEFPNSDAQQGLAMLRLWLQKAGNKAQANTLETALSRLGRDDIIQQCVFNIDQTGFDLLKDELGPSRDASLKRDIRVDNVYTDKDSMSIDELSRLPHRKAGESVEKDDKEERKYVAEEKEVEEKKSVSERRKEIEERLQQDKENLIEKSVTKVVVEETIITQKQKINDDLAEKEIAEEKHLSPEEQEPSDLTFEQKRLSFEQGKKLIELKPDKKKIEVKKEIDDKFVSEEIKVAESEIDETSIPFQEKRLSFERGLKAAEQKREERSADDQRRDSELFEGVSQGLVSLDKTFTTPPQDLLSPKVSKTPPPSPAEFKDTTGSVPWKEEQHGPQAKTEPVQDWATKRKPDAGIDAEQLESSLHEKNGTLRRDEVKNGTNKDVKICEDVTKLEENTLDFTSFYQKDTIQAVKSFIEAESAAIKNISDGTKEQTKIPSVDKSEVKAMDGGNKLDEKLKEDSDKNNEKSDNKSEKSFVGKVSKKIFGVFKKDSHKDKSGKVNGDMKEKSKGKVFAIDAEKGKEKERSEENVTIETVLETAVKETPVIPEKGKVTFSKTVSDIVVKPTEVVHIETENVATVIEKLPSEGMEIKEIEYDINSGIKNMNFVSQAQSNDYFKDKIIETGETSFKALSDAKNNTVAVTKLIAVQIVQGNDSDKQEPVEHFEEKELGDELLENFFTGKKESSEIIQMELDKDVEEIDKSTQEITQMKGNFITEAKQADRDMTGNVSIPETNIFKTTKLASDKVMDGKDKALHDEVQVKDFQVEVVDLDMVDKLLDPKFVPSEMKELIVENVLEINGKCVKDSMKDKVLDTKEKTTGEIVCAEEKIEKNTEYITEATLDKVSHLKNQVTEEPVQLKESIDNKASEISKNVSKILLDLKHAAADEVTEGKENITKSADLIKDDIEHRTKDFDKTLSEKLVLSKDKALDVGISVENKITQLQSNAMEKASKIDFKSIGNEIVDNNEQMIEKSVKEKTVIKEENIDNAKGTSEDFANSVDKVLQITQIHDWIKDNATDVINIASEKIPVHTEKSVEISENLANRKSDLQDDILVTTDVKTKNLSSIYIENSLRDKSENSIKTEDITEQPKDSKGSGDGYETTSMQSKANTYQLSDIKHIAKDIVDDTLEKLATVFPERQVNSGTVLNTPSIDTFHSETITTEELTAGQKHLNEPDINNAKKEDEKFTNILIDMLIEQESMKLPVLEETDTTVNMDKSHKTVTSTNISELPVTVPKTSVEVTSEKDDFVNVLFPKSQTEKPVSATKLQNIDLRNSASDDVLEYFCKESEPVTTECKYSEEHVSYVTTPTLQRRGLGGSQRLSREERPALRDVSHLLSESSSDEEENAYIVTEPIEKSPLGQRKVTFRFDSEEDPNWEPSSDSDLEVDVQEMTPSPIPPFEGNVCLDTTLDKKVIDETEADKKIKRVERRFERMASETLESTDPAECSTVDDEFQRMISQLSNKEVDACLTAWDEGGLTPSSELDSKDSPSGDLEDGLEQLPQALKMPSRNPFDVSELINFEEEVNDVPSSMFWAFENVPTRNSIVEPDDLEIPIIRNQTKGNQFSDQCLTQVNRESFTSEIYPELHLNINTLGSNSCCRAPSPIIISVRQPCNLLDSPLGYVDPHSATCGAKDESSAGEVKETCESRPTGEVHGAREGEENLFELAAGFRDTPPSEDDAVKKPPPPKSQ